MYDSLLLLLVMIAGISVGSRLPSLDGVWKFLQNAGVMALLFAMGVSMRILTDSGPGLEVWGKGIVIALAAVAGSVALARVYRLCVHGGEEL